jgi:hypothetical protein
MGNWPKDELLRHGAERIRRYQHNIRAIREAGCAVPTSAMIDSLDPAEIELWFADGAFRSHRLENVISALASEMDDGDDALDPGKSSVSST